MGIVIVARVGKPLRVRMASGGVCSSHPVAALAVVVVPMGRRVRFYCTPESNQWRKETRPRLLERPPKHFRNSIQDLHEMIERIHDVHTSPSNSPTNHTLRSK